jgi:2-keto-4-pentenoate hydratase/2-oxohepta-3-ene-1,7-dioic acid hydratase in catechol pathway
MRLYLALLESSPPHQSRIFAEFDNKLVDLRLAYAAYLTQAQNNRVNAYDLAACYFPATLAAFLERGDRARSELDAVVSFVRQTGAADLRGPAGEKIAYDIGELRLLPPFPNPDKSIVIGFSDRARIEAMPKAEIPTGFYKLPQTFVTTGAPVRWPKFSTALDADACVAVVIGRTGKRIAPENAWHHVAGATLMIDITARDIHQREGLTNNNLLGKNFPSSTCLGPALLIGESQKTLEALQVELSLDGSARQKFALRDCVFSVAQIIARWSMLGVKPGDWLAIGASMAIDGDRLQTPVPLKIGSQLTCSTPTLGTLTHQIIAPGGPRR